MDYTCDECHCPNVTLYGYGGQWLCDSCLREYAATSTLPYADDPIIAKARASAQRRKKHRKARS